MVLLGTFNYTANSTNEGCSSANFQYDLFKLVYSIVFVLGLIGNMSALCILLLKVKRRGPTQVYIINLAVADIIFISTLPFKIHYHLKKNDWIFGDIMCRITGSLFFININISIAFMTCICIDRYIAVVHPFKYINIRKKNYAIIVSLFVWALAIGIMVALTTEGPLHNSFNNQTSCFENFSTESWSQRMSVYNILALSFGFVIPCIIITICYPLIAKRVSRMKSIRKNKALKIIYLILAMAFVCFLPYHITHLLHFLVRLQIISNCAISNVIYKMRRITLALISFNSCLDPILYYFATASPRFSVSYFLPSRKKKIYTIYDRHLTECSFKSRTKNRTE
ncbi:lysophosphatidic acid receptor 6-like [Protopterus annectens]|uniref:lysophosphatidic acid receptor 6-like n=1 Tax=Protopterus annectens TaxID=7888 RepID=UPI001CFACEFB|nr:lysophosphatidic acid receptor 6-like [Protopterus annectens]